MNEKFGCDYGRGEEAGVGIETAEAGLFADVGQVAEIPGDKIVDLMYRGDGNVDGIGDVFAAKDASVDIAVGEDSGLLGQVELF